MILHLHGGNLRKWYEERTPIFRRFIRMVLNQATAMIVLSESFKNIFDGLLPLNRVFVVANGIENQPKVNIEKRVLEEKKEKRLTILYLGTLNRYKGVLVLIKSIPYIIKERPDIRFIMDSDSFL